MRLPKSLFFLFFVVVLICGGILLIERMIKGDATAGFLRHYEYPAKLTLTNQSGQQLDVTIIARNAKFVQFTRQSDNSEFVYAIIDLDAASAKIVERFPDVGLINAGKHLNRSSLTLSDVHESALRENIAKMNHKIASLNRDIENERDAAKIRGIENEMLAVDRKRTDLIGQLEYYDVAAGLIERAQIEPAASVDGGTGTKSPASNGSRGIPIDMIKALDSLRNRLDQ